MFESDSADAMVQKHNVANTIAYRTPPVEVSKLSVRSLNCWSEAKIALLARHVIVLIAV